MCLQTAFACTNPFFLWVELRTSCGQHFKSQVGVVKCTLAGFQQKLAKGWIALSTTESYFWICIFYLSQRNGLVGTSQVRTCEPIAIEASRRDVLLVNLGTLILKCRLVYAWRKIVNPRAYLLFILINFSLYAGRLAPRAHRISL